MKVYPGPILALLITGLTLGCATPAPSDSPPAGPPLALGRVVIEMRTNAGQIALDVPDSKADVRASTPSVQWVPPKRVFGAIAPMVPPLPYVQEAAAAVSLATPIVLLVGAPVAHELYRTYAYLAAESEASIEQARVVLAPLVRDTSLEEILRDRVQANLTREAADLTFVPSRREADTVVELMLFEPKITGPDGINPNLALRLGLRIRVLEAKSGRERYYDYIQYRGAGHRFVEWAAAGAAIFRQESERCVADLAREVTAQLIGRPAGARATGESLAAPGITHRKPLVASRPISPMLVPPRVRYSSAD